MRISDWSSDVCSSDLKDLGLSGTVDTATFVRILSGELPDGKQIGDAETRDSGRDFTFSMPKSASLLALVSGDKRILAAHMDAVKQTMTRSAERRAGKSCVSTCRSRQARYQNNKTTKYT